MCHAGIVGAALSVVDSREYRARIVQTAVTRLDGYLNGWSISSDGLCLEGVGYWDYGFGNYLLLAETLWRHSGGRINLYAGERVRQVATMNASGDQYTAEGGAELFNTSGALEVAFCSTTVATRYE